MIDVIAAALLPVFAPYWLMWFIGGFGIIEGIALYLRRFFPPVNNDGGTLSEFIWWLIRGKSWPHRLALFIFASAWCDLTLHFFLGTSLTPFW